jgi:hypothetical protein
VTIKQSLISIAMVFIFLVLLIFIFFPIKEHDLSDEPIEEIISEIISEEEIKIYEYQDIPGSILYYVNTNNNNQYLVHAEEALFNRYRFLKPMKLLDEETFTIRNLTHEILVTFDGKSIKLNWQRRIIRNLWPLLFMGFVMLVNLIKSIVCKVKTK